MGIATAARDSRKAFWTSAGSDQKSPLAMTFIEMIRYLDDGLAALQKGEEDLGRRS
jgi:hypothetical protein